MLAPQNKLETPPNKEYLYSNSFSVSVRVLMLCSLQDTNLFRSPTDTFSTQDKQLSLYFIPYQLNAESFICRCKLPAVNQTLEIFNLAPR